jgi:hypothetical protein
MASAAAASSAALAAEIASEIEDRGIADRAAVDEYGAGDQLRGMNVFAHKGCERLHTLLTTLATVFPENAKLAFWLALFNSTILGSPDREKWAMERWHREMTTGPDGAPREVSLYQKIKDRDVAFLLDSGVWVLDEIDATSMYNDPELDDEDREHICRHFERVNACAEWMATMPEDMMTFVMNAASSMNPDQALSPDTLFPLLQKTLGLGGGAEGGANADAMERIVGWTSQMLPLMASGGLESLMGIAGEAATLAGTAMPSMAAVLASAQSELMGCGELLSSASDSADDAQLSQISDVLKSWTGGAAAAGGAGSA